MSSSTLRSVGYDRERGVLEVEFKTGRVYRYFAVPARVHEALAHARSKGQYLDTHVRGRYRFEPVR